MAVPHPHKRAARAAAISIITFLAALAAVWLAPRTSDAVAAWLQAPPVRARTTALDGRLPVVVAADAVLSGAQAVSPAERAVADGEGDAARSVVVDPGMRFTMVGVTCRVPAAHGEVELRLRVSDDGDAWGEWYAAHLEVAAESGGRPQAFTEPVWTGAARYIEVAAVGLDGQAAAGLEDVRVVALNSTGDAGAGDVLLGIVRRTAAAVAGLRLAAPAAAMTTAPAIVTRTQWGADESLRSGSPEYAPVKMAFVHHTAGGNDYTRAEAAAVVRGAYYYHTKSLHWSDLGYNFLIDRFGTIYEGRYGGTTKGVIGAQVLGFNTGSTGVSLMGDFSDKAPPSAAVTALKKLLAWKLDVHHIDALGTATLVCGYGQKFATGERVRFNAISGHRDANYTACPGKTYGLLPAVRSAVAKIGLPKIYAPVVGPDAFSPDGDGVKDKTGVAFRLSEAGDWRVEIRDSQGAVVRHFTGTGTAADIGWGGNDDDGRRVPDGTYRVVMGATTATGKARSALAPVAVDTVPPVVQDAGVAPDPFSPDDDGHSDLATVRFQPAEAGTARVSVLGAGGGVLRTLTGWRSVGTGSQSVRWDGRVGSGDDLSAAQDGRYALRVELRDRAGNEASAERAVTLDRTLGFPTARPRISSPNGDGYRDTLTFGFKLTRRAEVTLAVMRGETVLRTLRPGVLAAGTQALTWDGVLTSGERIASGTYRCRMRAESSIGLVSVSEPFVVDRYSPRLAVPATKSVAMGRTAKVAYTVRDPYSPTVRVKVAVRDASGAQLASIDCGWVRQGVSQVCGWRPAKRGTYTLTFSALDRGGNRQSGTVVTALTVR